MKGRAARRIIDLAMGALCNLEHRGATGAEADTGDGAGILVQIPDRFLRAVVPFELPPVGAYGVGLAFLPVDDVDREKVGAAIELLVEDEGLTVLGWRDVPVDPGVAGRVGAAGDAGVPRSSSSAIPGEPVASTSTAGSTHCASA